MPQPRILRPGIVLPPPWVLSPPPRPMAPDMCCAMMRRMSFSISIIAATRPRAHSPIGRYALSRKLIAIRKSRHPGAGFGSLAAMTGCARRCIGALPCRRAAVSRFSIAARVTSLFRAANCRKRPMPCAPSLILRRNCCCWRGPMRRHCPTKRRRVPIPIAGLRLRISSRHWRKYRMPICPGMNGQRSAWRFGVPPPPVPRALLPGLPGQRNRPSTRKRPAWNAGSIGFAAHPIGLAMRPCIIWREWPIRSGSSHR